MLTSERERKICDKYSSVDGTGHVHCDECPLIKGALERYDFRCKANSHYNKHLREWVYDVDEEESEIINARRGEE